MTFTYEFGVNDEEIELTVSDTEVFFDYMDKLFGKQAKQIIDELGDYTDYRGFVKDNADWLKDMYEDEAREMWRDNQ